MKYINEKTGAIIETPCTVAGDWKPVDAPKKPAKKTKKKGADKK